MKSFEYKLKESVNGVKSLVFLTPTFKYNKFVSDVKCAMTQAIMRAQSMAPGRNEKKDQASDKKLTGSDVISILTLREGGYHELLDQFVHICSDSPICMSEGASVSKSFWIDLPVSVVEEAFGEYVANFISI